MKAKLLLLTLIIPGLLQCSKPPTHNLKNREVTTIPVSNERLYLAPIINETGFEKMDGWPKTQSEQKVLLKNFVAIWQGLKTEFRRCEKFGQYTVVEDDQNPSMRVSISLSQYEIKNDSIFIPVQLQVERISDGKFFIYSIPASTFLPSTIPPLINHYHYFGSLLSDYRRNFPYRQIVSFFYIRPKVIVQ